MALVSFLPVEGGFSPEEMEPVVTTQPTQDAREMIELTPDYESPEEWYEKVQPQIAIPEQNLKKNIKDFSHPMLQKGLIPRKA